MKIKSLFFFALTFGLLTAVALGQSVLSPLGQGPFFNSDGTVSSGGLLYSCVSGQACPGTPQATYTSSAGTVQNANPIVLNGGGFPANASGSIVGIWLTPATAYKLCLFNASNVQQWCADNIVGLATTQSAANQANTAVTYSATPTFSALAQNQLFTMTLTGNVTSSSLVMSGISTPAAVTFELTEDGTGNRTFAWPANFSGGCSINLAPNGVTTQSFWWDGTTAYAISDCRSNGVNYALPGEVRMYAGSAAPSGWLFCQGQEVSRTTYANLFGVIGTTYGAGDGSTTFDIPDLRSRLPIGAGQGAGLTNRTLGQQGGSETHTQTLAELASHTHPAPTATTTASTTVSTSATTVSSSSLGTGSVQLSTGTGAIYIKSTSATDQAITTASTTVSGIASAGSSSPMNIMNPFLPLNFICKY